MNKTSVAITAAFCVAIGFLIARFVGPSETPAPAKVEKAVVAAPTPAPQPAKVAAPKPVAPTQSKRPPMDEATKARYKAFGEETRKMALDLAGGDEKKLGQAFRNGMINPATQDLFKRGREIGEAMRNAQTDEERAALEGQVIALRDEGLGMLKAELDKIDATEAASQPAPAPAAPAPVIPAQGLM
ncbi:MAG: hypothetical protein EBR95_05200 [Verrucomicrobia bacterium]|nr:hypothetical protein [Verrucomicrobiota bacterium]